MLNVSAFALSRFPAFGLWLSAFGFLSDFGELDFGFLLRL